MKSLTYKSAGVSIDAGNQLVKNIKKYGHATRRSEVIADIGGFAGLFAMPKASCKNPVLVATTDGVGTKLKLALDCGHIEFLGQDLVAMCVNDLICCGAEPLFFLDYFATGKLNVAQAEAIIKTAANCLKQIHCTLLGGETAEMPGLYRKGDFDVAGFAVGVVDQAKIINGQKVKAGDHIIGLMSSGVHSNGLSLARHIIGKRHIALSEKPAGFKHTLGRELLTPTHIYVNPVLTLLKKVSIHAMAHITGGGLLENVPRVLPRHCQAVVHQNAFAIPPVFSFLQVTGQVPEKEMWRVFNMGIGFVMVVPNRASKIALALLKSLRVPCALIGEIKKCPDQTPSLVLQ